LERARGNFSLFAALIVLISVYTLRLISRFWIEAEAPGIELADVEESLASSLDFGE
jgi:hypothetical protein